jgi:hypothetical protein
VQLCAGASGVTQGVRVSGEGAKSAKRPSEWAWGSNSEGEARFVRGANGDLQCHVQGQLGFENQ